jgi:hypothetical protein
MKKEEDKMNKIKLNKRKIRQAILLTLLAIIISL